MKFLQSKKLWRKRGRPSKTFKARQKSAFMHVIEYLECDNDETVILNELHETMSISSCMWWSTWLYSKKSLQNQLFEYYGDDVYHIIQTATTYSYISVNCKTIFFCNLGLFFQSHSFSFLHSQSILFYSSHSSSLLQLCVLYFSLAPGSFLFTYLRVPFFSPAPCPFLFSSSSSFSFLQLGSFSFLQILVLSCHQPGVLIFSLALGPLLCSSSRSFILFSSSWS